MGVWRLKQSRLDLLEEGDFFFLLVIQNLRVHLCVCTGFPGGASGKEPACQCRRHKRRWFDPWVGKILYRQPTPVLLPGEYSMDRGAWWAVVHGVMKSWTLTERLHFHFSLSCIGEGSGNPLQCSSWRIPGTGEPGGLLSMGSHRVGHD